jgi:hypothetical protein
LATSAPTDLTDALIERIARLQSNGAAGLPEGLFPAERTHRYLPYRVADDSIFFTAATVYTLQGVRDDLSPRGRHLVDEITRRAVALYPRYLNKQGQKMYNFWQVHPEDRFFPNGALLSRFRHFRLPEDVDTTAYVYLTHRHADDDARWLKQRLGLDANLSRRRIRHTRPAYRHLRAYSTWLGEANMPLDFDVCALCNLLLMVLAYDLDLNAHDADTLRFITSVLQSDEAFDHPFQVAPWYADTAIILYHIARLSSACGLPELAACREQLVAALHRGLRQAPSFFERILLSTSLLRLGEPAAVTAYPDTFDREAGRFSFFVGSLLTAVDAPLTWALASYDLFHFRYRCRAHALALLLEHEVHRRRREPAGPPSSRTP